jgi:hypothetical protein
MPPDDRDAGPPIGKWGQRDSVGALPPPRGQSDFELALDAQQRWGLACAAGSGQSHSVGTPRILPAAGNTALESKRALRFARMLWHGRFYP